MTLTCVLNQIYVNKFYLIIIYDKNDAYINS